MCVSQHKLKCIESTLRRRRGSHAYECENYEWRVERGGKKKKINLCRVGHGWIEPSMLA